MRHIDQGYVLTLKPRQVDVNQHWHITYQKQIKRTMRVASLSGAKVKIEPGNLQVKLVYPREETMRRVMQKLVHCKSLMTYERSQVLKPKDRLLSYIEPTIIYLQCDKRYREKVTGVNIGLMTRLL